VTSLFIRVDLRRDATTEDVNRARDVLRTYVRLAIDHQPALAGAYLATITRSDDQAPNPDPDAYRALHDAVRVAMPYLYPSTAAGILHAYDVLRAGLHGEAPAPDEPRIRV
jgi:hypothetical protein